MGREEKRKAAKAAKRAAKKAKTQPNGNARKLTPATDDAAPVATATAPAVSPLAEAVAEARGLTIERDNGQATWSARVKQRQAKVQKILRAVGVWDQVDTLNKQTEAERQTIEARRQVINTRLGELDAVIRFLRPRQLAIEAAAKAAEE